MIQRAQGLGLTPTGMHDYRRRDITNLEHRKENAAAVAAELRHRATETTMLDELISVAQKAAWREVARNIEYNLESEFAQVPKDVEAPEARAARIGEVIRLDLPRLQREQQRLHRSAVGAGDESAKSTARSAGVRGWLARLFHR